MIRVVNIIEEAKLGGPQIRPRLLSPGRLALGSAWRFLIAAEASAAEAEAEGAGEPVDEEEIFAEEGEPPRGEEGGDASWSESDEEALLMVKTTRGLLPELTKWVKETHSYDLPETIATSVVGGSAGYLKWVQANTK